MNFKNLHRKLILPALTLVVLAAWAAPSPAVELAAVPAQWTPPDGGAPIVMWAYTEVADAVGFDCATADPASAWSFPTLAAAAGDTLTINLKNCLAEPVSVFVPGQIKPTSPVTFMDGQGRARVRSFDAEIAAGASGSYTWQGIREGTYLLQSGTHPQVQVQMGLYGALVVSGAAYPPVAGDRLLLFSEIDPALHAAVSGGTYGTATYPSTLDYYPAYFLINGASAAFPVVPSISMDTSADVLLRFVNAGLKSHAPTLDGGLYMTLVAEDGNLFPFTLAQYGFNLPPAKTIDAVLNIGSNGIYNLYDRSLALLNGSASGGGMHVRLQAGAAAGAPTAVNDAYAVAEDALLTTTAGGAPPGVLDNDTAGTGPNPLTASLVSDVSAGSLALNADGSFTYSPNPNFTGSDQFTYVANDGGPNSNAATVSISVTAQNDPPSAANDAYDVVEGTVLNVAAPGVLGNDSDIDGDPLTAALSGPAPAELTAFNADGSFSFDATLLAAGDSAAFAYVANDGAADSAPATVTINVVTAAANLAPVAVDDSVSTPKNTVTPINVISNDYDPDGTIDANSVVLSNGITTRGGTVVLSGGGIVTYTPPTPGFRGTDTFTYTVNDNDGATSNAATVRVNVTK